MTTRSFAVVAPPGVAALPVDARGYPVPYFVEWIDGQPDFRVMRYDALVACIKGNRCWVCGRKLGRMQTFVIGPMCAVNRISAEPPSHPGCAAFAARACPFLTHPMAKRPPVDDLIAKHGGVAPLGGVMLPHNPGVTLLWHTLRHRIVGDGRGGVLFEIGKPERCDWLREGRRASRAEVLEAVALGFPQLRALAEAEGPDALAQLDAAYRAAEPLFPADPATHRSDA